ncbi:MAG: membrane protease subunit, partial [Bacteroidota bacterium]
GRAALQEAEYTRQIARLDAEAQIELATGEAEANEILVEGLGGPDNYLKWLYIQMLDNTQGDKQVIYVPQSEFLPIGEAGRSVSRPIPAE